MVYVFDALNQIEQPKILRLQLYRACYDNCVCRKISARWIQEYIDEISEEISGTIPGFVIERQKWLL